MKDRILRWGRCCSLPCQPIKGTSRVNLLSYFNPKYFYGVSEYVFPSLSSADLRELKKEIPGERMIIIFLPREKWIFNNSWTGWKEEISYTGKDLGKVRTIQEDHREVLILPLGELKDMPADDIRRLFTLSSVSTKRWVREKLQDGTWDSPKALKGSIGPKIYPVPFLLESIMEGQGYYGESWLYTEDYENPRVIYRGRSRGKATLELRYPEATIYEAGTDPRLLEFLFGIKTLP